MNLHLSIKSMERFVQSATRGFKNWADIWRFTQKKSHLPVICVTTNQINHMLWRYTFKKSIKKSNVKVQVKTAWKLFQDNFSTQYVDNGKMCSICNKRVQNLGRHMKIHTKEKQYACHLCDYKCNQSCNLKSHIQRMH